MASTDRLHTNDTALSRIRRGVAPPGKAAPAKGEWTPSADALFRSVLDGIVGSALIDYGEGKRPAPSASIAGTARPTVAASGKWSFSKACEKVTAELRREQDATPGAGHYDIRSLFADSKFGMRMPPKAPGGKGGRGRASSVPPAGALGPGSYNTLNDKAVTRRSPSPVKMAVPTLSRKPKEQPTPGPGDYNADKLRVVKPHGSGGTVLGTSLKYPKSRANTPGPGQYEQKTMQGRKEEGKWRKPERMVSKRGPEKPFPGPGAYELEQKKKEKKPETAPAHNWGTSSTGRMPTSDEQEKEVGKKAPGPGAYHKDEMPKTVPGAASFGNAPRAPKERSTTPGPGAYEPEAAPVEKNASCAVVMRPPSVNAAERSKSGGRDPFAAYEKPDVPGPGAYMAAECVLNQTVGGAIGTAPRRAAFEDVESVAAQVPGPGQYQGAGEVEAAGQGRGVSFARAPRPHPAKDAPAVPGPGAYSAEEPQAGLGGHVIGTAQRGEVGKKKNATPGPGAYQPQNPKEPCFEDMVDAPWVGGGHTMSSAPTHRLPQGAEGLSAGLVDVVPGPGAYDTLAESSFAAAAAASKPGGSHAAWKGGTAPRGLLVELDHGDTPPLPGPGAYDTAAALPAVPGGAIGNAPTGRAQLDASETPGPGSYISPAGAGGLASGVVIGTAARPPVVGATDDTPGPGAYDVVLEPPQEALPITRQTTFTTTARPALHRDPSIPGPGQYATDAGERVVHDAVPGVSLGTSVRGDALAPRDPNIPGPGQYAELELWKKGKAHSFGSGKREVLEARGDGDGLPGPGAYDTAKGTAATATAVIGTEPRAFQRADRDPTPGPGAYEQHAAPSAEGPLGPGVTIADRVKGPAAPEHPGPGSYSVPAERGTGVVIGTATRGGGDARGDDDAVPGPGAYSAEPQQTQRGIVIAGRPRDAVGEPTPGPGQYVLPTEFDAGGGDAGHGTLGTAARNVDFAAREPTPGPGTYQPRADERVVGGVMGDPRREAAAAGDLPGPGAYDPATTAGDAGVVIGTEARRLHDEREGPGPGHYETHTTWDERGAVLSVTAPREEVDTRRHNPGPGQYALPGVVGNDGPAYSMGTAVRQTVEAREGAGDVGPGHYETGTLTQGPAAVLSGGRAEPPVSDTPGPGAYAVHSTVHTAEGGMIGTAMKGLEDPRNDAPGPGAYDAPALKAGPAAVITGKLDVGPPPGSEVPGPGHYSSVPAPEHIPGGAIGTEMRVDIAAGAIDAPGPGAYNVAPPAADTPAWSLAPKHDVPDRAGELPGPGQYLSLYGMGAVAHGDGTRVVIGTEVRAGAAEGGDVPGPGHYTVEGGGVRAEGGVIGTALREGLVDGTALETPGPGAYTGAAGMGVKEGGVVMGTERRGVGEELWGDATADVPGPGAYEAKGLPAGQAAIIGGRDASDGKREGELPGPGAYDPDAPQSQIAHTIGTSMRPELQDIDPDIPGPGAYGGSLAGPAATAEGVAPGVSFPKAERSAEDVRNDNPGPGSYQPQDGVGIDGPAAVIGTSMRADLHGGASRDTPGPGAYHAPLVDDGGAGAAAVFGSAPKFDPPADPTPGPGAYVGEDPSLPTAPQYSMQFRSNLPADPAARACEENPGPGQYALPPGERGPAATFGKGKVLVYEAGTADNPGPGAYYTAKPLGSDGGPAMTIGKPLPEAPPNMNPGPGAYAAVGEASVQAGGYMGRMLTTGGYFDSLVSGDPGAIPGPGMYYRPLEAGKDAPKFSLGARAGGLMMGQGDGAGEEDPTPGPGHYHNERNNVGMVLRAPGGYIADGYEARGAGEGYFQTPGPGEYYKEERFGDGKPRAAMSRESRGERAPATADNPPPGAYHKHVQFGEHAPKSSIRPPRREAKADPLRGPGSYPLNDHRPPRAMPFGKAPAPPRPKDATPGPGSHYKAVPLGSSVPAARIGGPRRDPKPDPELGPGTYRYYDHPQDRACTIGRKLPQPRPLEVPSPTRYSQDPPRDLHRQQATFAASRTDQRGEAPGVDLDAPGPGMYETTFSSFGNNAPVSAGRRGLKRDLAAGVTTGEGLRASREATGASGSATAAAAGVRTGHRDTQRGAGASSHRAAGQQAPHHTSRRTTGAGGADSCNECGQEVRGGMRRKPAASGAVAAATVPPRGPTSRAATPTPSVQG